MNEPGTLMWIGDRYSPEFAEPYACCESNAAQLAIRTSLVDAVDRPAAAVSRIIITQSTRAPLDEVTLRRLANSYPRALILTLQGSLCEGMRTSATSQIGSTISWHRWNQILPSWLESCVNIWQSRECRSVAVVAQNLDCGEALLALAESAGVTALWCPVGSAHRFRNIDTVWWDDSVAKPVCSNTWKLRLAAFGSARHSWIVNAPRHSQQQQARQGGVEFIFSKPHRIDCLLDSIAAPRLVWKDQRQAA
jgi:hypothetical protein